MDEDESGIDRGENRMLPQAVLKDLFESRKCAKFKCAPGVDSCRIPGNAAILAALASQIRLSC